jgi:hypothetical protein
MLHRIRSQNLAVRITGRRRGPELPLQCAAAEPQAANRCCCRGCHLRRRPGAAAGTLCGSGIGWHATRSRCCSVPDIHRLSAAEGTGEHLQSLTLVNQRHACVLALYSMWHMIAAVSKALPCHAPCVRRRHEYGVCRAPRPCPL